MQPLFRRPRPKIYKVFLTGGDLVGWALDTNLGAIKRMLTGVVEFVDSPQTADLIYSVSWFALLDMDPKLLRTKIVVSAITHDVRAMLADPRHQQAMKLVNYWVAPSQRAVAHLRSLGLKAEYVSHIYGDALNQPVDAKMRQRLIAKYQIPTDKYLIGSFQRDTEGKDLVSPKLVKGPDLFVDVVTEVYKHNRNIHVVLAGPRRFWIIKALSAAGIPFTYVGKPVKRGDDLRRNTLELKQVRQLYDIVDLYLVCSRMEGGPKAVMETVATRTKVLSTDVGIARELLEEEQICDTRDMPAKILRDIKTNYLQALAETDFSKIKKHLPEYLKQEYIELVKRIK